MKIKFDGLNIDNNAIHIVIEKLIPLLKFEPSERFRELDLDNATDKHLTFYTEIFIPYCVESSDHFDYHHNDFATDSWCGEQVCLSKIHFLNQKAWWLLHYYAIKESLEKNLKAQEDQVDRLSKHIARCIIDGEMSVEQAVDFCASKDINMDKKAKKSVIDSISEEIATYKDVPSYSMLYR